MKEELSNSQHEDAKFVREKRTTKYFFWIFFFVYLISFILFWSSSISEFGFLYIFCIGFFISFFLAWASSLFLLLLNMR